MKSARTQNLSICEEAEGVQSSEEESESNNQG